MRALKCRSLVTGFPRDSRAVFTEACPAGTMASMRSAVSSASWFSACPKKSLLRGGRRGGEEKDKKTNKMQMKANMHNNNSEKKTKDERKKKNEQHEREQ